MVSTRGRYALRIMIHLAIYSNDSFISLKDISNRYEISAKYLEQIIALLNKAGYLISSRGNNGGYKLSKDPKEYTAGDILRVAEGSLSPINCLKNEINQCERSEKCITLDFWKNYYKVINDYVDSVTLYDLAENAKALTKNDFNI
ncbi:MAG: Rrf2 family transcriptional regulator [Ruminococcus sp.]|nr:Rrf2 family transcriptional regulator [Ruminococcus sp.]